MSQYLEQIVVGFELALNDSSKNEHKYYYYNTKIIKETESSAKRAYSGVN